MKERNMFAGTDLGLDPDAVIDPEDESDLPVLYLLWQRGGFAAIDDSSAVRLRQWIKSSGCPLQACCKDNYLNAYDFEARNRERMKEINQFFRIRAKVWGIRLAILKNPYNPLVYVGEGVFAERIGSKPGKLIHPKTGEAEWTKKLLPKPAFRGCLYGCLDSVRKKGGVEYLLTGVEQLKLI